MTDCTLNTSSNRIPLEEETSIRGCLMHIYGTDRWEKLSEWDRQNHVRAFRNAIHESLRVEQQGMLQ